MELAVSQTCQTARRIGKRFMMTKLNSSNHSSNVKSNEQQSRSCSYKSNDMLLNESKFFNKSHTSKCFQFQASRCLMSSIPKLQFSQLENNISKTFCRFRHDSTSTLWIPSKEIEETLAAKDKPYMKQHTCYLTSCDFCCDEQDEKSESAELTLFINAGSGNVICKNCGKKTTWVELRKTLLQPTEESEHLEKNNPIFKLNLTNEALDYSIMENFERIDKNNYTILPEEYQNISYKIYENFNVSFTTDDDNQLYLIFPYFDITKKTSTGFKKIAIDTSRKPIEITKNCEELGLFGWNNIAESSNEIILTCSELDSLAIAQSLSLPTLSLPFGSASLPPELLPFLEQFNKITLWFDNDYKSKENLNSFARKLGLDRCFTINNFNEGGPFKVLQNFGTEKIANIYSQIQALNHEHIVTFKELVENVYNDLIHAKENAGTQFKRFPALNDYLKGHRRGELTIFTGPTGSGKTTFLSELSLDLCMQGVRTLWGSFEIKNHRLINILLHQYSGLKIEQQMEKFHEWSNSFQHLPFYFMTYYGAQDLSMVLKTIKYAVYNYDIEHVIIDNLQFMISVNRGEDRFAAMDKAISAFRSCASEENIHITVVVHPRKENDGSSLQTASIYGSAKASQEADNILILQNSENLSMQVSKNRYSGSIGTIPLKFNPDSLCLSGYYRNPFTNEEILPFLRPKRPIQKLKVFKKESYA